MKDFDLFSPILKEAKKYGRFMYLLGSRGDSSVMYNDVNRWKGDDQRTMGEVLIYDESTGSMHWKSVYKSSKGLFFKKKRYFLFVGKDFLLIFAI